MRFLTRYNNPFAELDRFFEPLDRWDWPDTIGGGWVTNNVRLSKDKDNAYVQINATGFKKEEISVEVENDALVVRGTLSKESNGRGYFAKNFEYSWTLTDNHDKSKIESKLENGILTIAVPFKTPEKRIDEKLRIEIK